MNKIQVSGINVEWNTKVGTCSFENLPVAMMWVDTTLAGLMSGVQAMVGTERFGLALQSEGRKSVEDDWKVISEFSDFKEGFKAIANIAAVAGWGDWRLISIDEEKKECRFQIKESWEGIYQKALRVCWGSGMLAGKLGGYCSKYFKTNCWSEQIGFIAKGDEFDEFVVRPSVRSIEKEIESLLVSDEVTRADMAVALEKLRKEVMERKQVEQALRESEKRYRELVHNANSAIIRWKSSGNITFFNEYAQAFFGYDADEVIGKHVNIIVPETESTGKDQSSLVLDVAAHPARYVNNINENICRDGRRVWMIWTNKPVFDRNGQIEEILAVGTDITQQKLAEEALRQREEFANKILSSSLNGLYIYDVKRGKNVFINSQYTELTGYTAEDLEAMEQEQFFALFHPDDANQMAEHMNRLARADDNSVLEIEYRLKTKGGRWIWCISRDSVFGRDKDGSMSQFIGTFLDNTARKKAEEEKKKMESQLLQYQKMEAIGTLAGGIAHNFNNLLMAIQGQASLMSVDLEPSHPHTVNIKAIEDHIKSATELTKQLLGVARKGKYEARPIDINELLLKSAAMFGQAKKELQIHTKLHKPPPVVTADKGQIEQVLLNLYINAWQAMPSGGDLYLETQLIILDDAYCEPHNVKPGRYAKVSVTDTGIGMDEAVRQRIFDPFFTTKEESRGTGLGLASAYGIIKNHEGFITVYSEVGHGSAFNIYLPLSDKQVPREDPTKSALIRGSETILLVDDEEMIIEVGQALLEKLGYRVIVASGGEPAVDIVKKYGNGIDLVILDLIMPGIDGGKAFDLIREIQSTMPIILSSGYSLNGQAEEIMSRGCEGFIQKPFNIFELSQKVREILDESADSNQKSLSN